MPPDALMAPEGESFPDVERLNIFFKRKLAKAKTEDEPAIREEWTAAKARFYGEPPPPEPPPPPISEAEAIAAARKAYGDPIGTPGGPRGLVSAPPPPIQITVPKYEAQERNT